MRCYNPDEITVAVDDERLVSDAGLLLPATLTVGRGCASYSMPTSTWGSTRTANAADKAMTVVHSLLAGQLDR